MPSVMTTASGIPASIASTTAALAKAGGTKTTDTSAPVSFDRLGDGAEDRHDDVAVEVDRLCRPCAG